MAVAVFFAKGYEEIETLNKITNTEYRRKPYAFKYGNFKLSDLFHEIVSDKG